MRYHWTECPGCGCQIAVNTTRSEQGVTGSLRRWSNDRSVNDGRPIKAVAADGAGGFSAECVCGHRLSFGATADAVGTGRAEPL